MLKKNRSTVHELNFFFVLWYLLLTVASTLNPTSTAIRYARSWVIIQCGQDDDSRWRHLRNFHGHRISDKMLTDRLTRTDASSSSDCYNVGVGWFALGGSRSSRKSWLTTFNVILQIRTSQLSQFVLPHPSILSSFAVRPSLQCVNDRGWRERQRELPM